MAGRKRTKYFTLEQAQALTPMIHTSVFRIKQLNEHLQAIIGEIDEDNGQRSLELAFNMPLTEDQTEEEMHKIASLKLLLRGIQDEVDWLDNAGCIVNNVVQGQIVLATKIHEKKCFYAWTFGDPALKFAHLANEPFEKRRPIDELINELAITQAPKLASKKQMPTAKMPEKTKSMEETPAEAI